MESFTANNGLTSVFTGDNVSQQSGRLWRPWTGVEDKTAAHKVSLDELKSLKRLLEVFKVKSAMINATQTLTRIPCFNFQAASTHGDLSAGMHPKTPRVIHPVKLFWPKSRCFDYLYQDAEMLLRNYPVQATICLYEDSSSDEDSDDEEEEMEKELN
ncbi:Protein ripply2 [Collichthys lucidus]|uniref:Protein ripply2 n=1 Tax=Collichthys lucidus TaxID=240159 RepID=A0A4U5UL14_COLLU|nr:Protein ripply2 [Collichthys lucidus]